MSDDYDVGYGKPPKSGQFKKGQSGNPSGKKAPPKLDQVLQKALAKTVSVTVDGKKQKLSMVEVMIQSLVRKGANGELRAIKVVLDCAKGLPDGDDGETAPLTAHQLALLEDLVLASKQDAG